MKKPVRKIFWVITVVLIAFTQYSFSSNEAASVKPAVSTKMNNTRFFLYDSLHLAAEGLSRAAFEYAMEGYQYLLREGKIQNDETVSIIDFTLPSTEKRLFVVDVKLGKVLFNTYVSHGRNSGKEMATEFSNDPQSYKSSLGFYVTAGTYTGKHGYSLKLEGEEPGINDNALARGIVMHSAPYVSERTIDQLGFLGRSQGCPAVPGALYKSIITAIKDGSCLFIYSDNNNYLSHSPILKDIAAI